MSNDAATEIATRCIRCSPLKTKSEKKKLPHFKHSAMKTCCLALFILTICLNSSFSKVKNAYASGADAARESFSALQALLYGPGKLTNAKRRTVESSMKAMADYLTYYELTESLLAQFKAIAPELYNEIDTIRDRVGRPTDVYVRFIAQDQANVQAWGITNIGQTDGDTDRYKSEFGDGTVSVKIWVVSKALLVLAHELGHVKVLVPKLADYVAYYKATYPPGVTEPNNIGHKLDDVSGLSANQYAKLFQQRYVDQSRKGSLHLESPLDLQQEIRKRIRNLLIAEKTIASL